MDAKGKAEDEKESRGDCAMEMKSWKMMKRGAGLEKRRGYWEWTKKVKRQKKLECQIGNIFKWLENDDNRIQLKSTTASDGNQILLELILQIPSHPSAYTFEIIKGEKEDAPFILSKVIDNVDGITF
ncbi:hypothetical protein WR25_12371 [Diploscapter pachys]|uniref:Uncharacterized protein n=1 Tax=Diploscapter pachys TaxID=2018661 RepID=A0A2A2J9Y0_9BILA|nr:hypothetical protein WR25_12371 [Diploscapter pachys]